MNRPNRYNLIKFTPKDISKKELIRYALDLETYCNDIENKLHNAVLNAGYLGNALNEACDKLEMGHRALYNLVTEINDCSATPRTEPYPMWKTKEEWKAWLLGNENK